MNQTDYAGLLGIKRTALANWETGYNRVSLDTALVMRDKFGLSLDFIYAGIDDALPMSLRNALLENPLEIS